MYSRQSGPRLIEHVSCLRRRLDVPKNSRVAGTSNDPVALYVLSAVICSVVGFTSNAVRSVCSRRKVAMKRLASMDGHGFQPIPEGSL